MTSNAMNKIVAIHQPNFFPWLGYFDKIVRAEVFIFLDDVQYPKKGGTWSNRVKLLISDKARWITASIDRDYSGTREIREMHFLSNNNWREKMIKSLEVNYRNHPHYSETMTVIEPLVMNNESNIAEYNIQTVTEIAKKLKLDTNKFERSSKYESESSSNQLLCELTMKAGGSTYMCGGGADGYQDERVFDSNNIKLEFQNFSEPEYPQYQSNESIYGLSIIDPVMNLGWEKTADILMNVL